MVIACKAYKGGRGGDPVKTGPKCWVIIANLNKEDLIEDEKEKKKNLQPRSHIFCTNCLIFKLNQ